jgi:hypothetical protein
VLYLDSSALVKRYKNEPGTDALNERLSEETKNARRVFTSVLTFAEIHAVIARQSQETRLSTAEAEAIHDSFDADWVVGLSPIELFAGVLVSIRGIVRTHPLRGADAVHLASAIWLRDMTRVGGKPLQHGERIVFGTSDKQLTIAAQKYNLEIFNPETTK